MKRVLNILLCLLVSLTVYSQSDTLFSKGNTLYNTGKYAEAITAYNHILEQKKHSAELYFNLANAYYKLNNIGHSIYYYEKALQLAPNDADIKNNLGFAKKMTIDAIETVPATGLAKLIKNVTTYFSFDTWAYTTVGFVCCFVLLFLLYYFAYATIIKRLAFLGGTCALMLACTTLILAFHNYNLKQRDKPAIVFSAESKVRNEPNVRSDETFRLHEGTKVQVLETMNDWKKIKLTDGKTGWMPSADLKAL